MEMFFRKIREALFLNELGGAESLVYRFSDADGTRTGKCGYSYGLSQFDLFNNWYAIMGLKDCGFTPFDLKELFLQNTSITHLDQKLYRARDIVDRLDNEHIESSMKWCSSLIGLRNVGPEAFVHIIDYHNQFYMSRDGKLHKWIETRIDEITPEDILNFKLERTKWGQARPDDVIRRFENIAKIFGRE